MSISWIQVRLDSRRHTLEVKKEVIAMEVMKLATNMRSAIVPRSVPDRSLREEECHEFEWREGMHPVGESFSPVHARRPLHGASSVDGTPIDTLAVASLQFRISALLSIRPAKIWRQKNRYILLMYEAV